METDAINVFVLVAEKRNFVSVGRLLGVSASAIGKRVNGLEEQLGVRLFHRSTRSLTLTPEGLLFLERGRRILAELGAATTELSQIRTAPRGRLRISLPIVGEPFLSVLSQFKLRYPEVDLDLDFSDRRVDLIEEGFDAAIRSGELPDSRLSARRIGTYRMLLVGAPCYFEKYGTPKSSLDLLEHSCIQFRYPNTGRMQPWPLGLEDITARLPVSIVCSNLEARIHFALQGVGIAYLPDFVILPHLAAGNLVEILPEHGEGALPFHIMWPSGGHVTPKFRVFVDFLSDRLFPLRSRGQIARTL